jgi:hypothetical protein
LIAIARTAAVLASGALVTVLSGCFALPAQDSLLESRDLRHLLQQQDSPDGTELMPVPGYQDVEEITELVDSTWYDTGGVPSTCVANFSTSFLVTEIGDDPAARIVNLGYFDYDYETAGLLRASARVFADSASAGDYLSFVKTSSQECVTGYRLTATDPEWNIVHVEATAADQLELPPDVVGLYHEETAYGLLDLSYRDTFLQYRNAVVVISCELHAASPFDYSDCDDLAEAVAERLVEAR